MSADQFTYFHPLRVRWGECDAQGIVFFANYFMYFDVAMTEYFRELGFAFAGEGALEFYTVNAHADYAGSAVFDDDLKIGVRCARLGSKSMMCRFAILRDETLLVEGEITYVHAVPGTKDTIALPGRLIECIEAFEKTPPERKTR